MEIGQSSRPRAPPQEFSEFSPRKKCSLCCALRCSAYVGAVVFAITFPCNLAVLGGKLGCEGRSWRGFINRHGFIVLPVAAVTFTHHWILSEFLWSKNRKSVLDINVQSTLSNMVLWAALAGVGTFVSRRVLPQRSKAYRLLLWDYTRTRRSCANKYFPMVFGRLKEDFDWYQVFWTVSMYHILWGMASILLEREAGARYAMFFRNSSYSQWCSPRWREWRELEVMKHIHKEQVVAPSRWGSFLTNDKWKSRVE